MRSLLVAFVAVLALACSAPAVPRDTAAPPPLSEAPSLPSFVRAVAPAVIRITAHVPRNRPSVLTLGPTRIGAGVIFDPAGYALTVGYIVMDADTILVGLRDGQTVPARLVGMDLEHGLGILKLDGAGPWPTARLGDSRRVAVGDPTATLGVEESNELKVTTGSVQAIRSFAGYWEYSLDRAIIVAPANPAFGGSPLVNARGEVIGITSLRLGEPPHVNLAIPLEVFTEAREEVLKTGHLQPKGPRPWIGVYTVETSEGLAVAGGSPVGPAAEAGFQQGDLILRLNGEKVEGQEDFYRKLWKSRPGEELTILVLRENRFHAVKLRPIDRYKMLAPER